MLIDIARQATHSTADATGARLCLTPCPQEAIQVPHSERIGQSIYEDRCINQVLRSGNMYLPSPSLDQHMVGHTLIQYTLIPKGSKCNG